VFTSPESFDPDRFLGSRHTRDQYSPLGLPSRPCIGVATAGAIVEELVTELARGWDLEAVRDGRAEFDGYHWRPSRRLRVRLTPRVPVTADERAAVAAAVT
jgi:cytochrome P450